LAQGLVRRRVARRPSGDAAGRAAVVSPSIMEPIEPTGLLFCAGALAALATRMLLLKPNRAADGKHIRVVRSGR
jgi:hypothetical protein